MIDLYGNCTSIELLNDEPKVPKTPLSYAPSVPSAPSAQSAPSAPSVPNEEPPPSYSTLDIDKMSVS